MAYLCDVLTPDLYIKHYYLKFLSTKLLKKRFNITYIGLCLIVLTSLLGISGCNEKSVFEATQSIPNQKWVYEDTLWFETNISDTLALYNVSLNVRHTNEYEYNNLWLKLVTIYPDGNTEEAPLNIPMADDDGQWYGTGLGSILENNIIIQQRALLQTRGAYRFGVVQNMRESPLEEVLDLGIQLTISPE